MVLPKIVLPFIILALLIFRQCGKAEHGPAKSQSRLTAVHKAC
jgi:hypothetical protein